MCILLTYLDHEVEILQISLAVCRWVTLRLRTCHMLHDRMGIQGTIMAWENILSECRVRLYLVNSNYTVTVLVFPERVAPLRIEIQGSFEGYHGQ